MEKIAQFPLRDTFLRPQNHRYKTLKPRDNNFRIDDCISAVIAVANEIDRCLSWMKLFEHNEFFRFAIIPGVVPGMI
jgi:hypothetical protein